jgi:hypothetical protein
MPARTGKSTYVPGVGTTTRGKGGKAKTFTGPGKAPAGTKKVAEKSYDEVPTTIVTDSGISTSGFGSQKAAKRAVRAQKRRAKRVQRIVAQTTREPEKRAQLKAQKAYKAPDVTKSPPKLAKPIPANVGFSELSQPKREAVRTQDLKGQIKQVRSEIKETRKAKAPQGPSAAVAIMSSVPGKGPDLTQKKRVAARRKLQKARKVVKRSRVAADLPHLGPEEEKVARTVLSTGERKGANLKDQLAAAETGLVETGFKNLAGGDADSEGWRQERRMYYPDPTNVKASAKRFYDEIVSDTGGTKGKGITAGELAQTVQASAYPDRYDERKPEAMAIVKAFERGTPNPKAVKRLKVAKKEAAALGLKVAGKAPAKVVNRFKAIKQIARAVEKAQIPYVYGGGHEVGTPKNPLAGLDCSSSTVYVLNKAGVKVPNITSGEFGNHLPSGPGAVTVFYNSTHVFMRIGDRYWGTSRSNPKSGPGFIDAPSEEYLSQYSVAHVPGLGKKAAIELGINVSEAASTSFPGMTLSSGGTTATINEGSGATVGKPGFSKAPIKLTPLQKFDQKNKKLHNLGVGESSTTTSQPSSVLDEMEKKYGAAVA